MNVSFKASTINYANITKINPINKTETSFIGSFVELDKRNEYDYNALRTIANKWENGYSLAVDIFDNFTCDKHGHHFYNKNNCRYFAILDKNYPVKKLDSESILGIAQISKNLDNTYFLDFLQTNPKHICKSIDREFRNIGRTLVDLIVNILPNKDITTCPVDDSARAFYEKMNFKQVKNSEFMKLKR